MSYNNQKNKILLLILFLVVIVSVFLGRYNNFSINDDTFKNIIIYIRIPRIILAIFSGSILSVSGLIFQNVFRNPIASPDILGVTSGASFGAAFAILLPISFIFKIQIFAFLFAMVSIIIAYIIQAYSTREELVYLILSGIIVSSFFTAFLSLIKYVADPYEKLPSIVFWTMGGLSNANYTNSLLVMIVAILLLALVSLLKFKIKILSLKDDEAKTLGVNVYKLRTFILIISAFSVAVVTSITGVIGWISLIVPHITKIIFNGKNDIYVETSLLGGIILLILDDISRTLFSSEIPIGILSAILGSIVLMYLVVNNKRKFVR